MSDKTYYKVTVETGKSPVCFYLVVQGGKIAETLYHVMSPGVSKLEQVAEEEVRALRETNSKLAKAGGAYKEAYEKMGRLNHDEL
ncbi:hypothetical protein JXB28_04740 [Candidatus Woesearchaeota archaeon]|nr:hypothetical protein [Candidatus Woesearchaeota archaeon]